MYRRSWGINDPDVKFLAPSAREWLRKCVGIFRVPLGYDIPASVPSSKAIRSKLEDMVEAQRSFLFGVNAESVPFSPYLPNFV